ncbi:Predicted metal-binding protein [uncultured Clostridium sp.]|nr:Predicted metal-binding protein [uncultured Clostridium sp.]
MINIDFKKDNKSYNLKGVIVKNNNLISYMNYEYFSSLCKKSCPNYNNNWCCPPNSPKFSDYANNFKYSLVLELKYNLNEDSISEIHPKLRNLLAPLLINLENEFNGLYTDSGNCKLCKTCSCSKDKPCSNPSLIRYSMESMGIDLDKLSDNYFNTHLLWNNNSDEAEYCIAIASLLYNDELTENDFLSKEKGILKYINL